MSGHSEPCVCVSLSQRLSLNAISASSGFPIFLLLSFYPTDLKPDQAFHAPFTFTITLSVGICTKKTVSKVVEGVVPFRLHLLLMKCTCVGFSGIYDLLLCVSAVEHLRSTIYKSGPWCRDVLEVRGATPGVTNP